MKYKFWILIRDTLSFTETRVLKRHLIQKAQVKRDSYLRKWITRQAKLKQIDLDAKYFEGITF
jgi:hypothetical protein